MIKKLTAYLISIVISISTLGQVTISADSLKKHVYSLADDSLEGRGLGTPSGYIAANYIADYFKQIGLKTIGEDYLHPFTARLSQTVVSGNNVVGIVEGNDPVLKDEYIVLGAHFDHIAYTFKKGEMVVYNGADDNATGTAAIIELGRALVQNQGKLKRSVILVAFDGEECGLIGSQKFITQKTVPVENIKFMMSIDMIGRYAESNSLIMGAMGSVKGGDELLIEIADKHDIEIKRTGKKISVRTDSKSFGQRGIPALHVTSGIIGPYHKPEDDPESIDYEGMEKISGLLYDLTVKLANRQSIEPIRKLTDQAQNNGLPFFRYGLKANLGASYHAYKNEFFNGKRKFSVEVGLLTQFRITKNISLQPEVLYSTMASGFNNGNLRTHSLSTPVSLVIATEMNSEYNQRFYLHIGAYYSYHFSGSANGQSMDFNNTFEQNETGLTYGIGIEIMSVVVGVNFKHGLSPLMKDQTMGKITDRATYFSLGYIF